MPILGRRQSLSRREAIEPGASHRELAEDLNSRWEVYRQAMVDRGALDPEGRWINADNLSREQRQYVLKLQVEHAALALKTDAVDQGQALKATDPDVITDAELGLGLEIGQAYDITLDGKLENLTYQGSGEAGQFLFVTQKGKRLLGRMTVAQLLEKGLVDGAKYAYSLDRSQLEDLAA